MPTIRIQLVLAVLALTLAVPALSNADDHVTALACEGAWSTSSAAESCQSTLNDISVSNGQCRIEARCQHWVFQILLESLVDVYRDNDLTVPLAEVDDLHNCDGWLRVGFC